LRRLAALGVPLEFFRALRTTPAVAGDLYVKRNGLVHRGESVSWADVAEFRKLAREALAVEAECYERIRERFP
jgi:hypothetical protein